MIDEAEHQPRLVWSRSRKPPRTWYSNKTKNKSEHRRNRERSLREPCSRRCRGDRRIQVLCLVSSREAGRSTAASGPLFARPRPDARGGSRRQASKAVIRGNVAAAGAWGGHGAVDRRAGAERPLPVCRLLSTAHWAPLVGGCAASTAAMCQRTKPREVARWGRCLTDCLRRLRKRKHGEACIAGCFTCPGPAGHQAARIPEVEHGRETTDERGAAP